MFDGGQSFKEENRDSEKIRQTIPGKWLVRGGMLLVFVLLLIWIVTTSIFTVQEQEQAALLTFGRYTATVEQAGLHLKWPYPLQQVIIVDANRTKRMTIGYREQDGKVVAVPEEALMITGDENIVSADAVVEWRVGDLEKYLFNVSDPEAFLRNAAIASIRSVIGSVKLDYAITEGKTDIQGRVKEKLNELNTLYGTGILVLDLKFQDIEPPEGEVQLAFKAVTNAREEKNTKINNATKYANDVIPKARGDAQAMLEKAEAEKKARILNAEGDVAKFRAIYTEYAKNPAITKERLILETLEAVLPGAQIFITDNSGDTVKYLPLHELLGGRPSGDNTAKGGDSR
ncbi:MAG: FtsH protease activity modulator HflK [Candidatus Carbobacillus altaicus]|uniref:Protein HflK n=1 Tax=Candidatus Carbonibacillus altaicus TaxID=2163959 RepID=A0A2R6Y4D4_9BACL|nr:FtsH protease activity modulator HflK [Candidatus Carbobacillus altaicus]PTQ57512.1 MAG: HflK protein [Candidatus Carbobacillus altaicus]